MALPVTISGISTAVACVGLYKTTNGAIGSSAPYSAGGSFVNIGDVAGNTALSMGFTTSAEGGTVTNVSFSLQKTGTPTDNLFVEIYAASSGMPTGSVLATSDNVAGSGLTGTRTKTDFNFSTPYTLSASTQYCAVIRRSGSLNASNYYAAGHDSQNLYSGGGLSQFNGSIWTNFSNNDVNFSVTGVTSFYFFGRDSAASEIQAQKATDPTSSFFDIGTNRSISTLSSLASYPVSDVIHVIAGGGSTFFNYYTFDMSSDSWSVTGEGITGTVTTNGQTGAAQYGCSIVIRSNGNVVAFFNGAQTKKSGTNYARVYWSERTGVNTWSAAAEVDAAGAQDSIRPEAVLGVSDSVHLIWVDITTANSPNQRTLNSSNILQTASDANEAGADRTISAVSYDRSGTTKVVAAYQQSTTAKDLIFDSGNTPTLTTVNATSSASLGRAFNDGTDVYLLYRLGADSDLYVEKSTDDGGSWGTATKAMTATVADVDANLSVDGNIYQRGSDFVIPYVVNDNGTLKYNEYVVRSSTTAWAGSAAPSITLAMTATATLKMLASSSLPVSFNLAANAELKPLRATALLVIQTDLIANAVRYSPISAAPSLVTNLAANALRFTPTTSVLAVSADLIAAAKQLMAAQSVQPVALNMAAAALRFTNAMAAPQVSFDLSAATIQRLAGLATLSVELSVVAAPVQRMVASAVLPVSFDLIANATIQGQAGQLIQMTAALAIAFDLSANAVRYTPTTGLLAVTTEMIANAVRYSPVSAAPSVVMNLAAQTTQLMAGNSVMPVAFNLAAAAKQLMAANATLAINFNMAANGVRYTPTTALLAAEISMIASTRLRLAASASLPIVLNLAAAPVQRMRAQTTASVVFGMQAFATIAGQVVAWPGSAVLAATFSLSASTTQLMAARSTQAVSFALAANANLMAQARAQADVVTSLSASVKLLLSAQASMAVETAMQVDAKARLAAYAGAMVELSMDARVVALSSMSSIATAEFDLIARAGLTMPVLAEMGAVFDLFADAEVKFLSPIQSITVLRGIANRSQGIDGIARAGQIIRGVARRTDEL